MPRSQLCDHGHFNLTTPPIHLVDTQSNNNQTAKFVDVSRNSTHDLTISPRVSTAAVSMRQKEELFLSLPQKVRELPLSLFCVNLPHETRQSQPHQLSDSDRS